MFGGNITGVYKDLVPYERIVQAWRMKHWPEGHYSDVTLKIQDLDDQCRLELHQTDIPAVDFDTVKVEIRVPG